MSTQVRLLENAGLVSRTTDSADARAVLIRITAKGRSVLAQVHAERGGVIDQRLAWLDDADRRTLAAAVPNAIRSGLPHLHTLLDLSIRVSI